MIQASEMLPLLVKASPGFASTWEEFQAEWGDQTSLPHYLVLGDFARHMSTLLAAGDHKTLRQVFDVIERFHLEGDAYVKEAATIGLLEDLQNSNLHEQGTSPEQYIEYLRPETARWWKKVEVFWAEGKIIKDD